MNDIEFLHEGSIPPVCPLTESQRGVYLECINTPESLEYNISVLCRLPAGIDAARFIDAVKTAAGTHKVLNVRLGTPGGVPSMLYSGDREINICEKYVGSLEAECRAFIRPFDLENGQLYRFELLHTSDGDAFLMDIHHTIFDGTSMKLFLEQIAEIYDGGTCAQEDMTVFDFSAVESASHSAAEVLKCREFYRSVFEGFDCDSVPLPDQISDTPLTGTSILELPVGDRFCQDEILSYVKANGITENILFLGAFGYALAKLNGADSSFFTTAHHGRTDSRLSSTLGMFVRTLPILCRFDEKMAPAEFLASLSRDYQNIKKNNAVPFSELAVQYGLNNRITYVFQSDLFGDIPMNGSKFSIELLDTGEFVGDINVMLMKSSQGYTLSVHYRKSAYTEDFIRSFLNIFICSVRGMLTSNTLGEIILADDESKARLDSFNCTEAEYDAGSTVVEKFRAQAEKTPDNVCLAYCSKHFTYREVDRITDDLAAALVHKGIGREDVVGILIPRCEYMLLCSMGVLKAGGAYLPLDPTYPPERLNLMMQDSAAKLLIADTSLVNVITDEFKGERMLTDEVLDLPRCDIGLPVPRPDDLFVMLYTSGSTGTPKGVMYQHSNALVTVEWVKKYFEMGESSRVTAYASYGFDANVFDMYPAVTSGAQLHIISDEIRLDFPALREYFNENGITHTVMTTQVGRQFAQLGGLKTLGHLSVAGEKLTPPDVPEGFALYNLYGPSECSVITSAFRIDRRYKDVPIGKAVDNLKMYVVDKSGRLLPPNAVGELWIAGPHVTRGYLNRPEKMAEAYGNNPFSRQHGYERIYRSGDIVRFLSDGNLQFVGRRDAQVKVRGFRVELTEIEEVIRRFPGITDATVAAFDDPAGGKFVAAYVVSDDVISADALGSFIRSEKPPYMVPAVIMQIDAIPLTQNQKVNRKVLPVPERKFDDIVPPENFRQQKIFDIVAEVIGHSGFGITTDLYEAGLTSIGAVRLNVALADAFDVPVKITDIKHNGTVKKLEQFLAESVPQETYVLQNDYPLSQTQSGIFVDCMANPGTTVYNIPILLRLGDGVDIRRLSTAVKAAIDAHPYVKTALFTDDGGNIRALRRDQVPSELAIIHCDTLPERSALVKPYVLLGGSLYRTAIYETAHGNYLFMDFHHIVSDGTSEAILLRDIDRAYAGQALEAERFSGFEAALAEESLRSGAERGKSMTYWKELLSGCDTECMPQKAPESADGGAGYLRCRSWVNADAVKDFCSRSGLTLNAFFNGAFALVLSRFIGKDSVSYATIHNGRSDSRLATAVTMLVKTIPVTANITADTSVIEFIRSMQTQLLNSMSSDACSFAELASDYGVRADIMFNYQGDNFSFDRLCGEPAEPVEIIPETAKEPIAINVYLTDSGFEYTAEYRKDTYSAALVGSMLDSLTAAARAFLSENMLKNISLLSDRAESVYADMNNSDIDTASTLCHTFIERLVDSVPDSPAVIVGGETLTYGELNRRANIMAHALIKFGVGRERIIGLVLDRSKEIFITELAIMKAGGAFLPMIPGYPDERIEYCLTDSESPFVITTEALKAGKTSLFSADKPYRTLTVEGLLSGEESGNPEINITPEQLAYCIYTSGSTGKPKGVMVEHRNLSNFVQTDILPLKYYQDPNATGTCLATSSISFDMSLYEIYLPLCSGKTVCMATEEEIHNPLLLRDLMLKNRVQMITSTPSFLNNMLGVPGYDQVLKGLCTLVAGAEAFPSSLYNSLRSTAPDLQIINGYGPTETTVCCSVKELSSGSGITIGRPCGNVKYYVTDHFGNIQPPYAAGELIICGAGVSRGYVKLPEKNTACFFTLRGLPAYHSGDLVRLTADGEIEFGGRMDNQVKLRGFRVELDEIEKVMCSYPGIKQSKVLVRSNGTEDYLAGFFTASAPVDLDSLTAHLKSMLTYYMVPAALIQLDKMPLTSNGKIDNNAFPQVQQITRKSGGRRAAKKSLEQRLCDIFSTVLGVDNIYADDNFFELGGTSLSASKVTMLLMSDSIEVKYGDIFDHPTPESLAGFIQSRSNAAAVPALSADAVKPAVREALRWNTVKYAHEVRREPLGNVLLTGAVGFLGIHMLRELLSIEDGHIYCLVRKGSHESSEIRLRAMLIYYFSDDFDDAMKNRITVLDADITDASLAEKLADIPFDTVINCAACVKHFADDDILERINVHGVENLINICMNKNARLVHISTVSVPGLHTAETYEKQIRMHENELFVIDDADNKYGISKYHAELRMLDAIESGLRGKIIRCGNLMGRHSDGEFQINLETNMFLSGIRGFATMGKYPISHMTDPMRLSPVDCTARAIVLLSGTNDKFTAFNCDNRYGFDEMKIIDSCNRCGIPIFPEDDDVYYSEYRQKLADDRINSRLHSLAAYDIPGAHAVETDNLFTTNILYRIGFSWPLVDDAYLDRMIHSILTLDYFEFEDQEE